MKVTIACVLFAVAIGFASAIANPVADPFADPYAYPEPYANADADPEPYPYAEPRSPPRRCHPCCLKTSGATCYIACPPECRPGQGIQTKPWGISTNPRG